MAKKGTRRKFRRYIRGAFNLKHPLSSGMVALTLESKDLPDVVNETTWCSSVKAMYSLGNMTPLAGRGPIVVGWAHSDYTAAQIESWLEIATNWDEGDLNAQEVAKRKCRIVGTFPDPETVDRGSKLSDGRYVRTKINWLLTTGKTLQLWVYHGGDVNLAAEVVDVVAIGHANLWSK